MNRARVRTALAFAMFASAACSSGTQPTRIPGMTVTHVSPASGPAAGGTSVTVNGHNLPPGVTVRFGTAPAASVQFVTQNVVVAVTGPHPPGVVDVVVGLGGGSASLNGGFTYTN